MNRGFVVMVTEHVIRLEWEITSLYLERVYVHRESLCSLADTREFRGVQGGAVVFKTWVGLPCSLRVMSDE